MYRLSDFNAHSNNFFQLLKKKWDSIHDEFGVFRYKLGKTQEKFLGDKYLIQLNPDRGSKRRAPEPIDNICQPLDNNGFNFTKISPKEVIFRITKDGNASDIHTLLVNVSPLSRYHTLLCPSLDKCLPQIITPESLLLAIEIYFVVQDRDLRIGFNSLCGWASVNHLHYHLFLVKSDLPVESLECTHLLNHIFYFLDYPIPGFCFEVPSKNDAIAVLEDVNKLLEYFLKKSIAHNVFLTRGHSVVPENKNIEVLRILVWPRKNSAGAKQYNAFNVAVCEMSGWLTVYDPADFEKIQKEDIENELNKWRIDNFEKLCDEIKLLFT